MGQVFWNKEDCLTFCGKHDKIQFMEASRLKNILEQHKFWLETNGKKGQRANLTDAILKGVNLTGAQLSYANLINANLINANLTDANLTDANLYGADLYGADLTGAYLTGAYLTGAYLSGVILTGANGLPDISWIIPGCLIQMNSIGCGFCLKKQKKYENFIQDSIGFFIQDNLEEETFDMLVGDKVIRGIPDWVKYSGMKKIESV